MPNAEQLLYATEKSSQWRVSIDVVLKNLSYSWENTSVKFLRTLILKKICVRLILNWLYEVIVRKLVSGSHLKPSWLSNITKYQSLSNPSFKTKFGAYTVYIFNHGLCELTFTLSCEPMFHMFISNGYYTKRKRLQSLDFLCVLWLDTKYCRWNCATVTLEPIHYRNSLRKCSIKNDTLRNFAKIQRKTPVPEPLF